MQTTRQNIRQRILQVIIIAAAIVMTSCSSDYGFDFKTPNEAINACKSELNDLLKIDKADVKQLTEITNRWIALQDSTIRVMARPDSTTSDHVTINQFFSVADSIRRQISKIAYSEERSIADVVFLKMNTTYNARNILKSDNYKKAMAFYRSLDAQELYDSPEKAVKEYHRLLDNIGSVKKENDLLAFIQKEDACFRSVLKYQSKISLEDIEVIAEKTEKFFDNLQYAVTQEDNDVNDRLLTFLNIRINRRVIQNAAACIGDIAMKKELSTEHCGSYRWAIMQPFLSIDKYLAAYLTEDQKTTLEEIGKHMPEYLHYLDEREIKSVARLAASDSEKLSKLLANSLLSMYLKQNI